MVVINVLLALAAVILFFGVVGEKDKERHRNITIAFVALVVLIIAVNTFM